MTHLRQRMLDELQRRNYSQRTAHVYVHALEDSANYFHRSPERLGPNHIRECQVHLCRDRKLSPRTIQSPSSALRFLFVKILRRPYLPDEIPFPKFPSILPALGRMPHSRLCPPRELDRSTRKRTIPASEWSSALQ